MAAPYVTSVTPAEGESLRTTLEEAGYDFREVDHALFGAKGESVNVVLYKSGKLVIQGKGIPDFIDHRLVTTTAEREAVLKERTIGSDETGKGDYFGPLVVCACALGPDEERFLERGALRDSKLAGDAQARRIAAQLAEVLPHEVIVIGPQRYNEMYASFRNLNRLLAWAHAKAIGLLFEKTGCKKVLVDQFVKPEVMIRALGPLAEKIDFESRTKAESNPAVGAASMIARGRFLEGLDRLEGVAGIKLPKGAGAPVLEAGKELLKAKGQDVFPQVAKLHFKTTEQLGVRF